MKDGAVVCNSGHFNVEIDIPALEKLVARRAGRSASSSRSSRSRDGRRIHLLADGRLINLAAAEGHPASVMDMSFANQALAAEFMVKNHATLEKKVYAVPEDDRPRDRAPEARVDGHAHRHADGRAGEVHELLGRGDLDPPGPRPDQRARSACGPGSTSPRSRTARPAPRPRAAAAGRPPRRAWSRRPWRSARGSRGRGRGRCPPSVPRRPIRKAKGTASRAMIGIRKGPASFAWRAVSRLAVAKPPAFRRRVRCSSSRKRISSGRRRTAARAFGGSPGDGVSSLKAR